MYSGTAHDLDLLFMARQAFVSLHRGRPEGRVEPLVVADEPVVRRMTWTYALLRPVAVTGDPAVYYLSNVQWYESYQWPREYRYDPLWRFVG